MQKRNLLFRRAQQTDSMRLRNLKVIRLTQLMRCSRKEYFKKIKPNSKQFRKTVRSLKCWNKTIPMLVVNEKKITSNTEELEVLANHFTVILPYQPYLPIWCSVNWSASPEWLLCTEEVMSLLITLDVTKACGPDGISASVLKATEATTAPIVTKLFNLSISTGSFPRAVKSSFIVQVSKSTDYI